MKEKTMVTQYLKTIFAMILSMVIVMTGGIEAFALGTTSETSLTPDEMRYITQKAQGIDPNNVDILTEVFGRGTKVPTKSTGLSYNFSASFAYGIYTNYCFNPPSNGKLKVSASVCWPQQYTLQKKFTVTLRKKGGKEVGSFSGYTKSIGKTGKFTYSADASKTFTNLDSKSSYYLYITKTSDGEYADLSGTVSAG